MKKIIAFDLDGTLAPSKSKFDDRMVALFDKLLEKYEVCVISGAKYELFERQFLTQISSEKHLLSRLHLMPTSGTRYLRFINDQWQEIYAENFTANDKKRIIDAINKGWKESGFEVERVYGETIEDRDSQITLSVLGQDVVAELGDDGVRLKEEWDPGGDKKMHIRDCIAKYIPDFNVRSAGATSIDITKPGIDKAYGMSKLIEQTGYRKSDILFMGDKIVPGGNDFAVYEFGIECISVNSWQDTAYAIEGINGVS